MKKKLFISKWDKLLIITINKIKKNIIPAPLGFIFICESLFLGIDTIFYW